MVREYEMSMSIDETIENAVMNHDRLVDEVSALREALRLKEAEHQDLTYEVCRIVSVATFAHLSGSEQQYVDHLYRVIHDVSGKLYTDGVGGADEE